MSCPPSGDSMSYIAGLEVQINGGFANLDEPCPAVVYATWDWGDGTIDEFFPQGDPPYVYPFPNRHEYSDIGVYLVNVRIYDADGVELALASCRVIVD